MLLFYHSKVMNHPHDPSACDLSQEDELYEESLRPSGLRDFVGQSSVIERLSVYIQAAQKRKEVLGHSLFCGPPGLGKTTLASIVAREMGVHLTSTTGPVIEKPSDLAGLLTNLQEGDILFIDEIHRLPRNVEEYLYTAMEDFCLDLVIDSGPHARSVQVKLNPFSLIGATTKQGLLSAPFRSRFQQTFRLNFYDQDSLSKIILRSASILNTPIEDEAADEIAKRSRGTPRIANNLLRWVRDFAQIKEKGRIHHQTVLSASKMLEIDELGLDEMDKKILFIILDHYNGGPVGLNTLAVAVGELASTLEEVYEPYLIMKGLLKRTLRGREATEFARLHLKK